MHPSKDDTRGKLPRPRAQRADHFSFPPTQSHGLLGPTTNARSSDQHANLAKSYHNLLDALNVPGLQQPDPSTAA